MVEMITQAMRGEMQQMESNMNTNAQQMGNEIRGMNAKMDTDTNQLKDEMKEMRGEMRQVGRCLQADKMATPRAATNELEGSAPAVRTG